MKDKNGNKKRGKILLIIAIILIIISLGIFGYSVYLDKFKEKPETQSYLSLKTGMKDYTGKYARLTIVDVPSLIAEKKVENKVSKFYVAIDGEDYMYLVRLSDETYENLKKMKEQDEENFSYTLTGYLFETPEEFKEIVTKLYNEAQELDIVNKTNFRNFFGQTYLDETRTPDDETEIILMLVGVVGIVLAMVVLVIYIVRRRK